MAYAGDEIFNPRTGQSMKFEVVQPALLRLECLSPPSSEREPEHFHPRQSNRFVVTEGTLTFLVEGELRQVGAGKEIVIPPGIAHLCWNDGPQSARYSQEFLPALNTAEFLEFTFHLAAAGKLNESGRPNILQALVLTEAYWNEIRHTNPPPLVQRLLTFLFAPVGRVLGFRASLE